MRQVQLPENFTPTTEYVLHLADNVMILGQRLGEWCGHGPVLEQDIAVTNIALDLIGQARMYYDYAARLCGEGYTEDDLAFLRDNRQYYNQLLVEQPNGDWAHTMVRQFLFDTWHLYYLEELKESSDATLASIAEKSLKEVQYHVRFSGEWMLRMGDGTEESHKKVQDALDTLWMYSEECFRPAPYEKALTQSGVAVDQTGMQNKVRAHRQRIIEQATLKYPGDTFQYEGGKTGTHSENLGYILAEMQFMQRAYPGLEW
jgi:ring-1,2-phenylacetyl-CoA epoxidase subunit PaaC